MTTTKPTVVAALAGHTGIAFTIVDDIDRAITAMSAGVPRPPRRLLPDAFEDSLASAIDGYRLREEVAALVGDGVHDVELEYALEAWRVSYDAALATSTSLRFLLANRAETVAFIADHVRARRSLIVG